MGFGKDGKGAIIRERVEIDAGALASQASILSTAGGVTLQNDFRIVKTEYTMYSDGATDGNNFAVGLADGHLSVTQIAACLTANGPNNSADRPGIELAERPVWILESYGQHSTFNDASLNKMGEKVFRWTFNGTDGWNFFIFNPLDGALTTGTEIIILAKHFGVWVT